MGSISTGAALSSSWLDVRVEKCVTNPVLYSPDLCLLPWLFLARTSVLLVLFFLLVADLHFVDTAALSFSMKGELSRWKSLVLDFSFDTGDVVPTETSSFDNESEGSRAGTVVRGCLVDQIGLALVGR